MPVFSCGGMRYQHSWQDVPIDSSPDGESGQSGGHGPPRGRTGESTTSRRPRLRIERAAIGPGAPTVSLATKSSSRPRSSPPPTRPSSCGTSRNRSTDCSSITSTCWDSWHQQPPPVVVRGPPEAAAWRRLASCRSRARSGTSASRHTARRTGREAAVRWDGDGGFDYVNLHWYYIYQANWPAIEEARCRDMGVFIISPADKGGMLYRPPKSWSSSASRCIRWSSTACSACRSRKCTR